MILAILELHETLWFTDNGVSAQQIKKAFGEQWIGSGGPVPPPPMIPYPLDLHQKGRNIPKDKKSLLNLYEVPCQGGVCAVSSKMVGTLCNCWYIYSFGVNQELANNCYFYKQITHNYKLFITFSLPVGFNRIWPNILKSPPF